MGHASVVGRQSGSIGRGHSPPLIEHAQMRQPHTPASRACAICKPRGEAKHTGRWHFRTGRQPAGRRALTAEDHCSSSRRVRHLLFPLADSDSPPTSGTPGTSTDTPTNTSGSRPTAMSEEAVRALIRQEVSAAVAAALRPPLAGSVPSGELRMLCLCLVMHADGRQRRHGPRTWHAMAGFLPIFPPQLGAPLSTHTTSLPTGPLPLSLQTIPLIPASVVQAGTSFSQPKVVTSTPTLTTTRNTASKIAEANPEVFKMASSIVPVPAKLVKKIQALEFIEMRELLPDNIALAERLATLPSGLAHSKVPNERDIGGEKALVTWVSSFATYIAIVAEAHPERVCDMLAYMRLVVREASKFGGTGWLTYDSVFRRNHEGLGTPWNYLDASLHQVYIAGQREKVVVPCKHCHEIDHVAADCAVASVLPKSTAPASEYTPPTAERAGSKGKRPTPYPRQRLICTSWNAGNCRFPGKCTYAHVCSACYGGHPASS